MSDWLLNEREYREVKIEFEKIRMKLAINRNGNVFGITDWDIREVVKEKKGGWFTKNKETVKETFYVVDTIYFKDANTPEGKISLWDERSGLMCTPLGINKLVEDRERYVKMKAQLKGMGLNIVNLPKRKKNMISKTNK